MPHTNRWCGRWHTAHRHTHTHTHTQRGSVNFRDLFQATSACHTAHSVLASIKLNWLCRRVRDKTGHWQSVWRERLSECVIGGGRARSTEAHLHCFHRAAIRSFHLKRAHHTAQLAQRERLSMSSIFLFICATDMRCARARGRTSWSSRSAADTLWPRWHFIPIYIFIWDFTPLLLRRPLLSIRSDLLNLFVRFNLVAALFGVDAAARCVLAGAVDGTADRWIYYVNFRCFRQNNNRNLSPTDADSSLPLNYCVP